VWSRRAGARRTHSRTCVRHCHRPAPVPSSTPDAAAAADAGDDDVRRRCRRHHIGRPVADVHPANIPPSSCTTPRRTGLPQRQLFTPQKYIARSANLPTGLYSLLALILTQNTPKDAVSRRDGHTPFPKTPFYGPDLDGPVKIIAQKQL